MQTDHQMARMEKPAHVVTFEPHGEHGPEMRCVCGWVKRHKRQKVREDAALRHYAKHGVTG